MFGTITVHVIIFEFVSVAPLLFVFTVPFSFLDHLKADNLAVSDKSENLSENGILTVNFLAPSTCVTGHHGKLEFYESGIGFFFQEK